MGELPKQRIMRAMIQSNFRRQFRQCMLICMTLTITILTATIAAQTDDQAALERNVKAAFIYKFTNYIEWPQNSFSQPDTPLTIAVMGDDQLAAELNQLVSGRIVNGRPIAVRKIQDIEPSIAINILFVGHNESARLNEVVGALQARPILIVTESEGSLTQGSIINFLVIDGHVRFEIAQNSAEKRGLKLSSRLLAVAQNVQTETP